MGLKRKLAKCTCFRSCTTLKSLSHFAFEVLCLYSQLKAILAIQCQCKSHSGSLPTITIWQNEPKSPLFSSALVCFAPNQFSIRLVSCPPCDTSLINTSPTVAKPELWIMARQDMWLRPSCVERCWNGWFFWRRMMTRPQFWANICKLVGGHPTKKWSLQYLRYLCTRSPSSVLEGCSTKPPIGCWPPRASRVLGALLPMSSMTSLCSAVGWRQERSLEGSVRQEKWEEARRSWATRVTRGAGSKTHPTSPSQAIWARATPIVGQLQSCISSGPITLGWRHPSLSHLTQPLFSCSIPILVSGSVGL